MGDVIHKTTKEFRRSVHTPDYDPAEWVINPTGVEALVTAGVPTEEWVIEGNAVRRMTLAEKNQALLQKHKTVKINRMREEVIAYISKWYNPSSQLTLMAFWVEALDKAYSNRKSKVQTILDWVKDVLNHFYAAKASVISATTIDAVDDVSMNLSQFDATAPSFTVEEVKNTVS